jgi:hypothetical protein
MDYIFSTDTTLTAINKINNRISGITYDDAVFFWLPFSSSTSPYYGASLLKRDPNYPNIENPIGNGNFISNVFAGGGNSGTTYFSYCNTIFAGTGHTIDDYNNTIFAGENNKILSADILSSINSSILGGTYNYIIGIPGSNYSSILNGSGNTIFYNYKSNSSSINSVVNGLSNSISGAFNLSWIGNGSGNTMYTPNTLYSKGNYILNGHDNSISNYTTDYGYNTIIGGSNNTISDLNNSIIVGSNLTALSSDTTHVNRMFFDKKIFANSATYSAYTSSSTYFGFDHQNRMIGIIDSRGNNIRTGYITINLSAGTYVGQILYLIGIPGIWRDSQTIIPNPTTYQYRTSDISLNSYPSGNVISSASTAFYSSNTTIYNPINYVMINNNYNNFSSISDDSTPYSALAVFVWDGTYWIRADHRGGA